MSNCINEKDLQKLQSVKTQMSNEWKKKYFSHAKVYRDLQLITRPQDFDDSKPIFYFVFGRQHTISLRDAVDKFFGAFWYQPKGARI